MLTALWIAAGGAAGSLARFGLIRLFNGSGPPWGTVVVNLVGCALLGFAIGVWGFDHGRDHQLALTVGVLGGFTTFSTFALDTIGLWEGGRPVVAIATVALSVLGGLLAAVIGLWAGRWVRA